MQIRLAIEADLSAIVDIYNAAIPTRLATADLEPITVESRLPWFRSHGDRYPVWVITDRLPNSPPLLRGAGGDQNQQQIMGWLSLQMFYGRPAYHKTAEVSIYIAPNYQGKGLGKKLLDQAIASCPKLDISKLVGFVFAHNTASCRLFKSFGFEEWGFLPQIAELDGLEQSLIIFGKKLIHETDP
ncbi:MAG: GNAT family N-acetyltransferase [Pseudanabaena sp.]|jgi:phosphinothricin acetyltransferase